MIRPLPRPHLCAGGRTFLRGNALHRQPRAGFGADGEDRDLVRNGRESSRLRGIDSLLHSECARGGFLLHDGIVRLIATGLSRGNLIFMERNQACARRKEPAAEDQCPFEE